MAKYCCICGVKKPGFFGDMSAYPDIKDGIICRECIYKMGYADIPLLFNKTSSTLKKLYEARSPIVESFTETRKIGEKFRIDDEHKLFMLGKILFKFEQLKDYRVFEDGSALQSSVHGIGRAVVGDMLYGGVGAIVGASTAKKITNDICDSLIIRLVLDQYFEKTMDITFAQNVSKSSESYKSAVMRLDKYTAAFDSILGRKPENDQQPESGFSEADEILKFKKLMDAGIITEEEFHAKKKQLLHI